MAATATAALFEHLGVTRVVWVDDIHGREASLDDVLALQARLDLPKLGEVLPAVVGKLADDAAVRREQFKAIWGGMAPVMRERAALALQRAASTDEAEAQEVDPDEVATIVGPERLSKLSPDEWTDREAAILADTSDARTLVLFDHDLSKAGRSDTAGFTLLQTALAKDTRGRLVCGLLTHTATVATQHAMWLRMATEANLNRDRFLVVSKECVTRKPVNFAWMLKLITMSPEAVRLKARAKEIIKEVADRAAARVDAIDTDVLDQIVFRGAYEEGMWEPDMLFRLHALFQRKELRQATMKDEALIGCVERMRAVSRIPLMGAELPEAVGGHLQREEMYEEGEFINGLRLPIEVGDIFAKTDGDGTKAYVLLGQPCDLRMRSGGKRQPDLTDAVLAEIAPVDAQKPYSEALKYFQLSGRGGYRVLLRRADYVAPCVLDFCAFNADGTSRFTVGAAAPPGLTPAWRARYERLQKEVARLLKPYTTFGDGLTEDGRVKAMAKDRAISRFVHYASNSRLFRSKVTVAGGRETVEFNCKRIARLGRQWAVGLGLRFAAVTSRPAFDRDMGASDGQDDEAS